MYSTLNDIQNLWIANLNILRLNPPLCNSDLKHLHPARVLYLAASRDAINGLLDDRPIRTREHHGGLKLARVINQFQDAFHSLAIKFRLELVCMRLDVIGIDLTN
jgi:hypothetical protein